MLNNKFSLLAVLFISAVLPFSDGFALTKEEIYAFADGSREPGARQKFRETAKYLTRRISHPRVTASKRMSIAILLGKMAVNYGDKHQKHFSIDAAQKLRDASDTYKTFEGRKENHLKTASTLIGTICATFYNNPLRLPEECRTDDLRIKLAKIGWDHLKKDGRVYAKKMRATLIKNGFVPPELDLSGLDEEQRRLHCVTEALRLMEPSGPEAPGPARPRTNARIRAPQDHRFDTHSLRERSKAMFSKVQRTLMEEQDHLKAALQARTGVEEDAATPPSATDVSDILPMDEEDDSFDESRTPLRSQSLPLGDPAAFSQREAEVDTGFSPPEDSPRSSLKRKHADDEESFSQDAEGARDQESRRDYRWWTAEEKRTLSRLLREGKTNEEISIALKRNINSVKGFIQKNRDRLRQSLSMRRELQNEERASKRRKTNRVI